MNQLMRLLIVFGLAALAGCSSEKAPMNAASAKTDGSAFMSGLAPGPRQFAMYCQAQLQQKLGGTVYVVASPSLQSVDPNAASATMVPASGTTVVYDLVKDGMTTTSSSLCMFSNTSGPHG